jgi:hypothetical protein
VEPGALARVFASKHEKRGAKVLRAFFLHSALSVKSVDAASVQSVSCFDFAFPEPEQE